VEAPPAPPALEDVIARVIPAVASIQAGAARGTGFFVRPDTLLTNAHVVGDQSSVQLQVGRSAYTARVTRLSPASDLAVLRVVNANPRQPVLTLGSGGGARVGSEVFAVGSALGVLSNTVTRGIVSAVRQVGQVRLVQTDAAINPGNSGGPLVDRAGQVIGVNSMTVVRQAGEGVAFAVAIEHGSALLSGKSAVDEAQPGPINGLQRMLVSPQGDGDEGAARTERAERAVTQALERAAQRADELDDYWKRYERWCVASAERAGSRAWFGVFQPGGVTINPTSPYDCAGWLETLRTNAAAVRTVVDQTGELARREGVYPGLVRELRTKLRLNWR
jgi:hypothetical protein